MGLNEVPLWHYGVDAMTFQIFTGGDFATNLSNQLLHLKSSEPLSV